jgi:hypothetical protein
MQNKQPEDTSSTQVVNVPVNRPVITPQQALPKKDTAAVKPTVQKPKTDTLVKMPTPKLVDTTTKRAIDTIAKKPINKVVDTIAKRPAPKPRVDTTAKKPVPPKSNSLYNYTPETPHYAVVIMDKVDPVFVNEAKNAFHRYNVDKYFKQPLETQILSLTNEIKLVLVSGFATAQAATDYAQRAKAIAPSEIIPWLTGNKYTFSIISAPNLDVLKEKTDISVYRKFLEQHLPGKF